MKGRCRKGYATFDERWTTFEAFIHDMGDRPLGTDLGRIDHALGYSFNNCFWQNSSDNRRRGR